MSQTLFVLGAGASREAGAPLMRDFLSLAEQTWRTGHAGSYAPSFKVVFELIDSLTSAGKSRHLPMDNIEYVFGALDMLHTFGLWNDEPFAGIQLGPAIRHVIARTLEARISYSVSGGKLNPPVPYEAFCTLLKNVLRQARTTIAIITFNYDVALDYALYSSRIRIDYCLRPFFAAPKGVEIMKLHGSLNWVFCNKCFAVPLYLDDYFCTHPWQSSHEKDHAHLEIASKRLDCAECGSPCPPLIVPPTWRKTDFYEDLSPVWRRAMVHLSEAENVFVIGHSCAETDQLFRYLVALSQISGSRLRKFWVFDPDTSGQVRSNYERVLGPMAGNRLQLHPVTFSQAIDALQDELLHKVPAG